jgi:hypothetical protein
MVISSTGLFLPQHHNLVSTIAIPILFGEVAFMLWLLVMGAREHPSSVNEHESDPRPGS